MKTLSENKIKRLSLRLTVRDYDAVEAECIARRVTFQEIGAQLLADWAKGAREDVKSIAIDPQHAEAFTLLNDILGTENEPEKDGILAHLRASAYAALLSPFKTKVGVAREIVLMRQRKATKDAIERPVKQHRA